MKKVEFTSVSKRVYAINFHDFKTSKIITTNDGRKYQWYIFYAVWYKRFKRNTFACFGNIDYLGIAGMKTKNDIIKAIDEDKIGCLVEMTGRYSSNGDSWFSIENREEQEKHIALLKEMLIEIPSTPRNFEGWYSI